MTVPEAIVLVIALAHGIPTALLADYILERSHHKRLMAFLETLD